MIRNHYEEWKERCKTNEASFMRLNSGWVSAIGGGVSAIVAGVSAFYLHDISLQVAKSVAEQRLEMSQQYVSKPDFKDFQAETSENFKSTWQSLSKVRDSADVLRDRVSELDGKYKFQKITTP